MYGQRLIQRRQGMRTVADDGMGRLGKGVERRAVHGMQETVSVAGGHGGPPRQTFG